MYLIKVYLDNSHLSMEQHKYIQVQDLSHQSVPFFWKANHLAHQLTDRNFQDGHKLSLHP